MYELSVVYYFTGRIIDAILSQNDNAYDANVRWRITDKIIVIYPNNDTTIVPIEQTGFFARERIFLWSQKASTVHLYRRFARDHVGRWDGETKSVSISPPGENITRFIAARVRYPDSPRLLCSEISRTLSPRDKISALSSYLIPRSHSALTLPTNVERG